MTYIIVFSLLLKIAVIIYLLFLNKKNKFMINFVWLLFLIPFGELFILFLFGNKKLYKKIMNE